MSKTYKKSLDELTERLRQLESKSRKTFEDIELEKRLLREKQEQEDRQIQEDLDEIERWNEYQRKHSFILDEYENLTNRDSEAVWQLYRQFCEERRQKGVKEYFFKPKKEGEEDDIEVNPL